MKTLQVLLESKGHDVWSVHPNDTVLDAIKMLASKDIGALVVIEDDRLVGIFSERDYARNVYLKGKSSPETLVRDVMAAPVICVRPDQSVNECMVAGSFDDLRFVPA